MERSVDLLLINPGGRGQSYQGLGESLSAIEPPVWAGLLATFTRLRGRSVAVLDANAENLSPAEVAERVQRKSPRLTTVVVYGHNPSASTQVMPAAGEICREIRTRGSETATLLVGGHVAALPERTLREETVDYVCDGEGPYTIVGLLDALHSTGVRGVESVPGLWYRIGKEIRHTPPAPLVGDLDGEMPGVAWDLLPMEKYRAHNWHCFGEMSRTPYASIYTSLGCPFRCAFCCIQAPFRAGTSDSGNGDVPNSYRMWKPETVIRQIDTLVKEYGVRNLKFADELFVLHPTHVDGICDLILQRGYDLNIWAYARVDTIRPEMLPVMRRAGIRWLALGIETASARVRKDARKGYRTERIREAVASIHGAGIHIIGNFIFGLPEDDGGTLRETLDLAKDLNCEFANFNCAMAYPGSALYDTALREGWPLPEKWGGYSQYSLDSRPLRTRSLPGETILRFRDRAFEAYFSNPTYLAMMRRTFGGACHSQLKEMVSHKLDRQPRSDVRCERKGAGGR